jgi:hypothetical protein
VDSEGQDAEGLPNSEAPVRAWGDLKRIEPIVLRLGPYLSDDPLIATKIVRLLTVRIR